MDQYILKKYHELVNTFNLLSEHDRLETFLSKLTSGQRTKLYKHKLLNEYDLLP